MKLLDWMQHTFRKTNNEHLTEFAPRNSCASLMDLQYNPKSYCHAKASSAKHFRKSFACVETARSDNEHESYGQELFQGFLTIGTLATTELETPTFVTTVEKITWKETEATQNELKLINGESEKVVRTEEKEDFSNRDSEESEKNEVICPLQSYLSRLSKSTTRTKEHRQSLGELFQTTKIEEEEEKNGPKGNIREKKSEKSAIHLMKKILKGKTLYPSSRHSIESDSVNKKPGKIQHIFNRKVHPEGPKSDDLILFPLMDSSKKGVRFCMSDSNGNEECWIKSDTEYLVLEVKGKKSGK